MKTNKFKIISVLLAAAMLCGCEKVENNSDASSAPESSAVSSETSGGEQNTDAFKPDDANIIKQSFAKKFEAEKGAFNGRAMNENGEELTNADDGGYVALKQGQYLREVVTVTASQFYRVIISARSEAGAALSLQVGDTVEGAYSIPRNDDEEGGSGFALYAVDNLYMSVGMNTLKFTVENGDADIDFIIAENSDAISNDVYRTGNACVSQNASPNTIALMGRLSEYYGRAVLTAQNVSCGANVEIDAVYNETKRYPAIRTSELALAVKDDNHSAEVIKKEMELAAEWSENGGICSYVWHWYSPNALRSTDFNDFDLHTSLGSIEPSELAMLDGDGLRLQLENGFITQSAVSILDDIDKLAQTLKPLCDKDIPILFEPVPDGDSGLFWWSSSAEDYRDLWVLTFDRLTKYNGLNNLIWVWNNSDFNFYPGDNYVDVIGQSIYANSPSSFAGRFGALAQDPATARKPIAITACDVLPNIDFLSRDNALWLWAAMDSGEYTINGSGKFSEKYTKISALKKFYNNELCVTRDELWGN